MTFFFIEWWNQQERKKEKKTFQHSIEFELKRKVNAKRNHFYFYFILFLWNIFIPCREIIFLSFFYSFCINYNERPPLMLIQNKMSFIGHRNRCEQLLVQFFFRFSFFSLMKRKLQLINKLPIFCCCCCYNCPSIWKYGIIESDLKKKISYMFSVQKFHEMKSLQK